LKVSKQYGGGPQIPNGRRREDGSEKMAIGRNNFTLPHSPKKEIIFGKGKAMGG